MRVEIIRYTPQPLQLCYLAARRCYSNEQIENVGHTDSHKMAELIHKCIRSGHMSILEHPSFTFAIEGISRVTSHQLVRHRIASHSQMSERYCSMENAEVVIPATIKQNKDALAKFYTALHEVLRTYQMLIDVYNIPKEDARYILPQGMETKIVTTMNVRELYHFFRLRCCFYSQHEIRHLAEEMLKLCKDVEPELFALAGKPCDIYGCDKVTPCNTEPEDG